MSSALFVSFVIENWQFSTMRLMRRYVVAKIYWLIFHIKDINIYRNIPKWNSKNMYIILQNGISPFAVMKKQEYVKKRRQLSTKLIEAREKAGLTQKQVAETGIVTQSELSKLENGSRKIEFLFLLELAELYGQPITFFELKG